MERLENMGDTVVHTEVAGANAQQAVVLPPDVRNLVQQAFIFHQDPFAVFQENLSGQGQFGLGPPADQLGAQLLLQPGDMVAQGLLGNEQPLGCMRYMQILGEFYKVLHAA